MNGKWIWRKGGVKEDSYAEFKCAFTKGEGRTVLQISADSEYAVFVNGRFVYGGQYADFPWYKVYDELDITDYTKDGENKCLIWVWYCGDNNFCHYVNRPALRFAVVCGGEICVESNENTLSRPLPYFVNGQKKWITHQIGYTFSVDFTAATEECAESELVDGMPEELTKRPISLLKILPKLQAKKRGKGLYDLGAETVGYPFISLCVPAGKTVWVSFGEWLREGKVPRIIEERDFSFKIVGDGQMQTVFNPLRKLGCRYLEIEGNAEVEAIGLLPLEYPFQERLVEIENSLRKRIYDVSIKTLKLNAMEHYYDCPWREQGFYALDGRHQMRYGYQAFINYEYQYAALKLMSEDRNPTGMISITVPTSHTTIIPSFALFYVVAMEEYAMTTGDVRLISEYFEKITEVTDKFIQNCKDDLVCNFKPPYWNFYEWNSGLADLCVEQDCALNLTFLLALQSLIKICDMLGKTAENEKYINLYKQTKKAVNARYYDEQKGLYIMSEEDNREFELLQAYAILTGIAAGARAKMLCEKLTSGKLVRCTLSMLPFKYDALMKVNEEKYKSFILTDIDTNYSYMLEQGATSFWETLLGAADFGGAGSLCHGWAAAPIYYYHKLGVIKNVKS